ncbi:uncharacterized protein LOC144118357 [Amblyomma americanum]
MVTRRWLRRFRIRFLLLTVFGVLSFCGSYFASSRTSAVENWGLSVGGWQRVSPVGDRIRTPGCVIPKFDPFDPSVRPYFLRRSNGSRCRGKPNFLTVKNGFPVVLEEKLKEHDLHPQDLVCFYKEIRRNESLSIPDEGYAFGPEQPLFFNRSLSQEFIYVECGTRQYPGRRFHDQFLLNPIIKEKVEDRCRRAPSRTAHNLSVLFLVLDSVSYLNFERHLPDTAQFLLDKLGAFQLRGYNKVGDNSYPNQMAFIAGLQYSEATRGAPDGFFDNVTSNIIWSQYGERGYRTMFLEEAPAYGLFTYFSHGFRHSPADYYLRHFVMATEGSPYRTEDSLRVPCLGPTMPCEELLDYLARFTAVMAERPFFSCAIFIDITHNNLNSAGYADEPFRRLLETLHVSGVLNHTVLIFLSDHGLRFGDLRATHIGKFEDRQPFAFLAFPPWFLKQNPEAALSLHINQNRLTTPFDVHAALVELLDYPDLEQPNTKYGLSLLHEVPDTRTCADASINQQWCTCNIQADAQVSSALASSLANHLVSTINVAAVRLSRKCVAFQLLRILDVTVLQQSAEERAANISHYWVNVLVSPGGGLFEGTVRVHGGAMTVLNETSRMDVYWPVSHCARNHWIERYCYCRRMTEELLTSL